MLNILNPRYWVYRIDQNRIKFFWKELEENRLRQGWGYDPGQNLRSLSVDEGAKRNMRMLEVKKGDILLVPRLPTWDKVAVVQAIADWSEGYRFQISDKVKDYGHIFPAQYLKSFLRASSPVSGDIRSTLRNPLRFWNIDRLADHVEKIRAATPDELGSFRSVTDRANGIIEGAFHNAFDIEKFKKGLIDKSNEKFSDKDWEDILFRVFENRYPSAQIDKAKHWEEEGFQLIDKIVIFTRASEEENKQLLENERIKLGNISLVFAEHLGVLLAKYGKTVIDLESDD